MNNETKIKLIQKSIEDKTGLAPIVVYEGQNKVIFYHKEVAADSYIMEILWPVLDLLPISDPLEEQPDKGWIPVSERLPDPLDAVLTVGKNVYGLAWLENGRWWASTGLLSDVTHWQPLPPPPSAPVK